MQGTILGQTGGSSSGLNVYAQLAEPSKKDGIWIKTKEMIINNKLIYTQLTNIPYELSGEIEVAIRK